jgi:integrase
VVRDQEIGGSNPLSPTRDKRRRSASLVIQKAAIILALFAGLRRGEIRGLRCGDIDLKTKQIDVQHTFMRLPSSRLSTIISPFGTMIPKPPKEEGIPFVKTGGIRFLKESVAEWLKTNESKTHTISA